MENNDLVEVTAHIVAAHLKNNSVPVNDVPALISSVHGALSDLGKPVQKTVEEAKPAVTVRSSLKPDAITCLECGAKQKMLKRHLSSAHDMAPEDYRTKWKLPDSYPMVAPNYAEQRSALAKANGLGAKGRPKAAVGGKRKTN